MIERSTTPVQEMSFDLCDDGVDNQTQQREDGYTGKQLFEIIERSGFQNVGTDAELRAQHFSGDQKDDGDGDRHPQT